jgi:hypothetical protein
VCNAVRAGDVGETSMRRVLLSSLILSVLEPTSTVAQEPGVYFCIVEKLAGIQPEREPSDADRKDEKTIAEWKRNTKRSTGALTRNPERFVLRVSPFQWKDETEREVQCQLALMGFGLEPLIRCSGRVKFTAELTSRGRDGGSLRLFSIGGNIFHGDFDVLWLAGDLSYSLVSNTGLTGSFAEEGKCQTF